jgi:hypothetical protein
LHRLIPGIFEEQPVDVSFAKGGVSKVCTAEVAVNELRLGEV